MVVRLNLSQIDKRLFSRVENAPVLPTTDIFGFESRLEFDLDYWTHKIYYIYDNKNNKIAQIMLVSSLNKRMDYYNKISFYWLFFNLYSSDSFHFKFLLSNIFHFFWISELSPLTRFDIKKDVDYIPRFSPSYLNNKNTRSQGWTWFCYSNKYKNTSASFEFRIYDKRLDIVDNLLTIQDNSWFFYYKDLLKKRIIWRIEIQYNSKKIKEKGITLSHLFDDDFLETEFNNYSLMFLDWSSGSKKYLKSDKKLSKKSFKRSSIFLKHTEQMFDIYLEKLLFLDKLKVISILKSKTSLFSDVGYSDIVSARSVIYSLKKQVQDLENKLNERK